MLDIRLLRENPEHVRERLATRGGDFSGELDEVLACDARRRAAETELQELQAARKRMSKEIGGRKSRGESTEAIEAEVRSLGERTSALNQTAREADEAQRDLLLRLPNLPHAEAPIGEDAADNPVVRIWGEKPTLPCGPQSHLEIGARLGLFDLERSAKISGSGFVTYTGLGARLERSLINFMLDLHTREHGYLEIAPPFLIRRECMVGTSQLPKFEDDMYGLEGNQMFLAPTAEVPVTNLHREELLAETDLPKKLVAHTPCFRREAGSAGKETRGLIRVHQFDKIELVKLTTSDDSFAELESLTSNAEAVLQKLGLHYRVIELCTGDVGFGAAKTYDLEAWAPGQQAWLEVSSCSNFLEFQARRMNLRYKDRDGKNRFCHTLNGSGTALPRVYVALLESGLQPDGSVKIPEALQSYFGAEFITVPAKD